VLREFALNPAAKIARPDFSDGIGRKIENTAFPMDEQNQSGPPQQYIWPRYVLGGVILGVVLAIIWMAVLVHRVRGQREYLVWPTNKAEPTVLQGTKSSVINSNAVTNNIPAR
jgi:hypothetical protein